MAKQAVLEDGNDADDDGSKQESDISNTCEGIIELSCEGKDIVCNTILGIAVQRNLNT